MKKFVIGVIASLAVVLTVGASRKDEVTLVMVPREDGAVRVGLDVANRYPTLLVSYQVAAGKVSLRGWNGAEWVNINLDDFQSGNFFKIGPDSALLIEPSGRPLPAALTPPESWCDSVCKITTTELRPMLHLVGQYYDFKHKDWTWFSENYKMSMDAINPEGLNVAWYHKQLGDHLKKNVIEGDDLKYWAVVRYPQPPEEEVLAVEPAPLEANAGENAEQPEMETPEDPVPNPFTNEAPAAVVLGAGEAEAAE